MSAETPKRVVVPCGSCSACCRFAITPVAIEEQAREHYDAEVRDIPGVGLGWALKRRPDGSCVYLNAENRCDVWDRAPATCREFDCRVEYARRPRAERRRMARDNATWRAVFDAAASRVETLVDDLKAVNAKVRHGEPS